MADISNKTIEIRNGLVGIGTTSPTQLLHVQGNVRVSGAFYDSGNQTGLAGSVLVSLGTGIAWSAISASAGVSTGLSGAGTTNTIAKFANSNSLTNSNISDSGSVVTIGVGMSVSGFSSSLGFYGPATFITNLNATNLASGTVASARISGAYSGITSVGNLTNLNVIGIASATGYSGNGANLTNLNATNLASGTVASARISGTYSGITSVGTLSQIIATGISTLLNLEVDGWLRDVNGSTGNSGQILSSTSSGVAWTSSASLGIITGSGSANQVTFWATNSRITGISTFIYNGALGIGTINPRGSLETNNEIYVDNIYFGVGNSFTNTLIGFAASDGGFLDGSVIIGYGVNDGPNSSRGIIIGNQASKNNTYVAQDDGFNHVIIGSQASSNNTIRPGGGSKVIIGENAYSYIDNNNDRDSGNIVVIGSNAFIGSFTTTAPDVVNSVIIGPSASFYSSHDSSLIIGYNAGSNTSGNINSSSNNIIIGNQSGTNFDSATYNTIVGEEAGYSVPNSAFSNSYNVLFGYNTKMSNSTYQIAIGANANVSKANSGAWGGSTNDTRADLGIGTFAAAARLHVQTLSSINNGILVAGGVGQTASLFEVDATLNGATYFIVTGIGSVGIYTSIPTQAFDINGGVRLRERLFDNSNSSGSVNQVLISTGSGIAWTTSAATGIVTGTGAATRIAYFANANTLTSNSNFIIDSSGNFGISTTIPRQRLDVYARARFSGDVDFYGSVSNDAIALSQTFDTTYQGVNNVLRFRQGGSTAGAVAFSFYDFLPNLFMTLDGSSLPRVGIGTTGPLQTLHVGGNALISGFTTSNGYFGPGTFITNLNASNLASGTVPSSVVSGSYSGITSVGTLTSLVVNGIATATTFIGNGTFINLSSVNDAIFNGNNVGRGGGNISGNVLVGGGSALANNSGGTLNSAFGWSALNQNTSESNNSAFGYEAAAYSKASGTTAFGARALSGTATTSNTGANNTVMGFGAGRYLNSASNVAVGNGALSGSSTAFGTGGANVAIGNQSMNVFTTALNNVAVGAQTLQIVTTGAQNVAVGESALSKNTTGSQNVAIGQRAGFNLDNAAAGGGCVLIGTQAGFTLTNIAEVTYVGQTAGYNATGTQNVALGAYALYGASGAATGTQNMAIGYAVMNVFTSGSSNVGLGHFALNQMTSGNNNVAIGQQSLAILTTGSQNIAIGRDSLRYTNVSNLTAIGYQALTGSATTTLNTGTQNTAIGYQAGTAVTSGVNNAFIGFQAGLANTSGSRNVFIGRSSGSLITTGSDNTFIGDATNGVPGGSYQIAVGSAAIPTASNFGAWGGNTNATRTDLGVGTFSPQARVHIETLAAGNRGLYIAGSASQTSNLIEVDATTNGSPLFLVTGIGSVGINTGDAPRYLYVQGDTRLNGPVGIVGDPVAGYPLSVSGSIYMRQGDILTWSAGNADILSGGGGAFDLRFRTYDGSTAARENMRIMSNGNVGIGTTGPFARLHVQGLATTNTPLIISGFGTPTVDLFRIEQSLNGTRYVTVGSAGSVGIGTSLPSQSLHIQNNSRFNGAIFDVNNSPGAPIGIVSQALFSTGTGVTWAPVKRNLVVPLMTAFNPTQVGIDSAIFIVPQDPINGTSSMTFSFRRVNVRVETPSAAGITTINIAKSTGTGQFVGTSILSANINLTGASTYEASGTSFAVGYTTASSGDKLAINFVGVNTFHQNLTVELIAIEA